MPVLAFYPKIFSNASKKDKSNIEEPGRLQSRGLQRVRYNLATENNSSVIMPTSPSQLHYTLFPGALISPHHIHMHWCLPPVHLPRPAHSPRGQVCVPSCQVHPDVTWASQTQHVQTKSIIFLFNLSPSSNPCSSKWYHHPL